MSAPSHRISRGRRRLSRSGQGTIHELNITPLLDLVMVLLIVLPLALFNKYQAESALGGRT